MAIAALDALPAVQGGIVITPEQPKERITLPQITAEHPEPGPGSISAGAEALRVARAVPPDGTLLVLLSGGASSLMASPADGITFEEKRAATRTLLRAGADITALNTVRKHLSQIKGGWLAAACAGRTVTLAISDVVGDDPSVIASGPTVPDTSTFGDALAALDRLGGRAAFPPRVVERLERATADMETPKPGDARLARSTATVIGSRFDAMSGAERQARALGYEVVVLDQAITGEARAASARHLAAVLDQARDRSRPLCVISSGESTVNVTGSGRGGRNQEFALAAVDALASVAVPMAMASVGTDGVDGPTDAAGAIADSGTRERARAAGLAAASAFLANNDAYAYFSALNDLIQTGPTGTNVGDVQAILLG